MGSIPSYLGKVPQTLCSSTVPRLPGSLWPGVRYWCSLRASDTRAEYVQRALTLGSAPLVLALTCAPAVLHSLRFLESYVVGVRIARLLE